MICWDNKARSLEWLSFRMTAFTASLLVFLLFSFSTCTSPEEKPLEATAKDSLNEQSLHPWLEMVYEVHQQGCTKVGQDSQQPLPPSVELQSDWWQDLTPELAFHKYDQDLLSDSLLSFYITTDRQGVTSLDSQYWEILLTKMAEKESSVLYYLESQKHFEGLVPTLYKEYSSFREFYPVARRALMCIELLMDNYDLEEAVRLLDVCRSVQSSYIDNSDIDYSLRNLRARYLYLSYKEKEALDILQQSMLDYADCPQIVNRLRSFMVAVLGDIPGPASDSLTSDLLQSLRQDAKAEEDQGRYYRLLAIQFSTQGKVEEAIEAYKISNEYFSRSGNTPYLAEQHNALGAIWSAREDYQKANDHLLLSVQYYLVGEDINSMESIQPRQLINIIPLHFVGTYAENLIRLYFQTQDTNYLNEALSLFEVTQQSLAISSNLLDHKSKTFLMGMYESVFFSAIEAIWEKQKKNSEPQLISEVYRYMESARSNIQLSRAIQRKCPQYGIPEALCDRERQLLDTYLRLSAKPQTEETVQLGLDLSAKRLLALSDTLRQINSEYYNLRYKSYEIQFSEVLDLVAQQDLEILEFIQRRSTFSGELSTYALFISPDTVAFKRLEAMEFSLHKTMLDSMIQHGRTQGDAYRSACQALYNGLVKPMASYMSHQRPLLVVPSGDLHSFSFELLLPQEKVISYSYSIKDYLHKALLPEQSGDLRYFGAYSTQPSAGGGALWQTEVEIEEAAKFFEQSHVTPSALLSKQQLLQEMNQSDVIHLAVHADVLHESDAFLSLDGDSTFVSFADIEMLEVPSSLVILSACRSNEGIVLSTEGAESIANSFHLAGARGVLSSIWDVPDISASYIIPRFMEHLHEGLPPNEALASAKKDYLNYQKDPVLRSPKYWSGFQYHGAL